MNSTQPSSRLRDLSSILARVAWLAIAGFMLAAFAAGVPVRWQLLQAQPGAPGADVLVAVPEVYRALYPSHLKPAAFLALREMGLSAAAYASYVVTMEVILAGVCAAVGFFIFWRRWDGWLAFWISLITVLLGTSSVAAEVLTLGGLWPGWFVVNSAAAALGMTGNLHMLFLSPDGRFVPRWTLWLAAGFTGGMLALALVSPFAIRAWGAFGGFWLTALALPVWAALLGVGFYSQVYRYRRVSTPMQRQQTKWVAIGLSGVTAGLLLNGMLNYAAAVSTGQAQVLINLAHATLVYPCLMLLPVCLAFSIVRYRLWDIDLLIRRTLIYSLLTAALAVVYLSSVVLLQSLFGALTGERQSEFVTVLSTLGIAALFGPLRRRVQDVIDRLFYRRKYDAAQTLAAFSASIRDETNLEAVTQRLARCVEEAIQPAHTSVWLRRK